MLDNLRCHSIQVFRQTDIYRIFLLFSLQNLSESTNQLNNPKKWYNFLKLFMFYNSHV